MKQIILLLLVASSVAQAEIYKSQNEKGEWIYSDRPSPQAKPLKLPPLSTYTPPAPKAVVELEPKAGDDTTIVYESMRFLTPENNLTIRDNEGIVKASVQLIPLLKIQRGHKIQYFLDGSPYLEPRVSSKLDLKGMDRGSHQLGAQVLDADGNPVFEATPVTFHIRRISIMNPNHPNHPVKPNKPNKPTPSKSK